MLADDVWDGNYSEEVLNEDFQAIRDLLQVTYGLEKGCDCWGSTSSYPWFPIVLIDFYTAKLSGSKPQKLYIPIKLEIHSVEPYAHCNIYSFVNKVLNI